MNSSRNILVVGTGLAGLTVSIRLIEQGAKVTTIGPENNDCTSIAAGMITPLVFRRMTKSWRVDELIPNLVSFYRIIEEDSGVSFFRPVQIRRVFSSEQERNMWEEKQELEEFKNYMNPLSNNDDEYSLVPNKFGTGRVRNAYSVDSVQFLEGCRKWLNVQGEIIPDVFDYNNLIGTTYNGTKYDDVVFCEGYGVKENPWFKDLPISPTKGDVLTIESDLLSQEESINRKCFVLPLGNKRFKIGSTYEWNTTDLSLNKFSHDEIVNNFLMLTSIEPKVIGHACGIRPTTKDRRPIIGTHFEQVNYHIFNGLGAKGFMIAPLLADEFAQYLLLDKSLNKEVDARRHMKK
jgi:glycine/D-amino acid oxidase-like deaminating enzyme